MAPMTAQSIVDIHVSNSSSIGFKATAQRHGDVEEWQRKNVKNARNAALSAKYHTCKR